MERRDPDRSEGLHMPKVQKVVCARCGLLDANPDHPANVCIYCVLELNRRIDPPKREPGEEYPGIGDS